MSQPLEYARPPAVADRFTRAALTLGQVLAAVIVITSGVPFGYYLGLACYYVGRLGPGGPSFDVLRTCATFATPLALGAILFTLCATARGVASHRHAKLPADAADP